MTTPNSRDIPQVAEEIPTRRVLVVDDESLIRWSLRQGLAERGHAVTLAANAADALAAIHDASAPFDVVILDYRLPDRQDLSLLEDVRRLTPGSIVIMMTAYGDDDMRNGAAGAGALAVLDKPFQVRSVVSLVESSAAR